MIAPLLGVGESRCRPGAEGVQTAAASKRNVRTNPWTAMTAAFIVISPTSRLDCTPCRTRATRLPVALPKTTLLPNYLWRLDVKSRFAVALVALIVTVLVVDVASAGVFGRRWERRRAELYGSLNASLSGQVNQQVAGAEERLAAASKTQIEAEAAKLNEQVAGELANLRKAAADAVATEAKRLEEETAAKVAALKTAAEQTMAAELAKLQDQIKAEVAKVREETSQLVSTEIGKARESLVAEQQKLKDSLMPEIKTAISAEVQALAATATKSEPQPEAPAPVTPTTEQPADKPKSDDALTPVEAKDDATDES